MAVLFDVRPLRESADYRRLWFGMAVSQVGQQITLVTIAYQVYVLTRSSFAVGAVGAVGLAPLIVFGLYGGAVADAFDRRTVALVASAGLWASSGVLLLQALLHNDSVLLLYAIVVVQTSCYAVNQPARSAILPRLLPPALLPAANALGMATFNLGFTVGPLLAGALIGATSVSVAYAVDVVTYTAALWALFRLPRMPVEGATGKAPGLRSVVEGLGYLRRAPNLAMTFVLDICAMALAQPRALYPALALGIYAQGAGTLGVIQAAPAVGSLVAFVFSGWISRVHRHGIAVVAAIAVYGAAVAFAGVAAAGPSQLFVVVLLALAVSGGADMVSSAYRSSILQTAAPDELRGRLQGVFIVVVAGGPRAGDALLGGLAELTSETTAMVVGGVACLVGITAATLRRRSFLAYDVRHPSP